MKKSIFRLVCACSAAAAVFSCYDDSALLDKFDDLENRVVVLESHVKTMNESLSSLSKIVDNLQKNDWVTSTERVTENGRTGWKINYAKGGGGNRI